MYITHRGPSAEDILTCTYCWWAAETAVVGSVAAWACARWCL